MGIKCVSQLRQPDCSWSNTRLTGRIPELDGVRGLAILLVLIEHYIRDANQIHLAHWETLMLVPFRLAWSGVDLFFVLSGFLIGGILLDAKSAGNYYRTFYARRAFRILPLYSLWFIIFTLGLHAPGITRSIFGIDTRTFHRLFNADVPLWWYSLFLQNIAMSLHRTVGAMWMGITWSLAVEEQFYLLLPVAIRTFATRRVVQLVCVTILLAPFLRIIVLRWTGSSLAPYSLLPCRADSLGYGVLVAVLVRSERAWLWLASQRSKAYIVLTVLGVCACVMTKLSLDSAAFVSAGFSVLGMFYSVLLLLMIVNPGRSERLVFQFKPLRRLGTISYAVYLLHAGISYLLHGAILKGSPNIDNWRSMLVTLLATGVVLGAASLSWSCFEHPLIKWAHTRFRYSLPKVELHSSSVSAHQTLESPA